MFLKRVLHTSMRDSPNTLWEARVGPSSSQTPSFMVAFDYFLRRLLGEATRVDKGY